MEKRGISLLVVVALALILFLQMTNADDVETTAQIYYENVAPILTQNIPDQYLAVNMDKINAFDLDDYFIDNETLAFSVNYLGDQNVTVTINSDNLVSFYPDTNFMGSINITFIADDTFVTTESNIVQIFVQNDTIPPQWSNPATIYPGTNIYQNTNVNFTTAWTDNFGLDRFIFMINEGAGWTSYAAESFTGTQNTSRYKYQITLVSGTVYWKFGAYDSSDNYNETDVQNLTVTAPSSPPPATGSSVSESGESEAGEGFAPASTPSAKGTLKDFSITPTFFNVELKQGSSITLTFKVTNTGTTNLSLTTSISGLTQLNSTLSETEFNLGVGESKTVSVMFSASESIPIELYFGRIVISGEDIEKDIPTAITLKPKITGLDLDLNVLNDYKQVRPTKPVKANLTLDNIADSQQKVTLYYAISDFSGNILNSQTEEIDLTQRTLSLEKELIVPESSPRGEYIFFARATSGKDTSLASDTFYVGSKFTVMGFIRANLLILLIVLASMIVAILMVKHYRNQERLRLLNLYIMITNLKKLLKEGDLENAIKLYVRIKATYGQPLSRSAMQNKEELKKEMEKLTEKLHSSGAIEQLKKEADEEASKPEAEKPETKKEADSSEQKTPQKEKSDSNTTEKVEEKPKENKSEEKVEEKPKENKSEASQITQNNQEKKEEPNVNKK